MLIKLPGEEKAGELDRGYLYNLDTSSAILKLFDVVQPEC